MWLPLIVTNMISPQFSRRGCTVKGMGRFASSLHRQHSWLLPLINTPRPFRLYSDEAHPAFGALSSSVPSLDLVGQEL